MPYTILWSIHTIYGGSHFPCLSCIHVLARQQQHCSITAPTIPDTVVIFQDEDFHGLTCFQIAHHPLMSGLWSCNQACKGAIEVEAGDIQKQRKPHAREGNTSHTMFLSL